MIHFFQTMQFQLLPFKFFVHAHSTFFSAICVFATLITLLLLIRIKRHTVQQESVKTVFQPPTQVIKSSDIRAVSGGDVFATQLDLARAYLEMGKKTLARKILQHVADHGDTAQKKMATQLLNTV